MTDYISREEVLEHSEYTENFNLVVPVRFIKAMKAADVQPVKRGRWESPVSVGNGIKFCSVCRNEAYWDTDYGQQLFDYCPYCGARMDLKDGDTDA